MSNTDQTAEDLFKSLNGFDEIAITRAFGEDLSVLRAKPFTFVRALVFVDLKRGGATDGEAHKQAMSLTMADLESYFASDEEVMPEDPSTERGKGAGLSN